MLKRFLILFFMTVCQTTFANLPYFPVNFPRDEAAHYKQVPYKFNHLTEWWYASGKLKTDEGRKFSYDAALFNSAEAVDDNIIFTQPMLHIQISDLDNKKGYGAAHHYFLNAGKFSTEKLDVMIDKDFTLQKILLNGKEVYVLKAQGSDGKTTLALDLILEPVSQPFLINENGLLPMLNQTNSYYYSIPHLATHGNIKINDAVYHIEKNTGDSWMDHQWGDFDVRKNGWEWFSLRLENGLIANVFLNYDYASKKIIDGMANIILPAGEKFFIPYKDIKISRQNEWFDEKLSTYYPMTFHLEFPSLGLKVTNTAAFPEQELLGYWEGYCQVEADYLGQPVKGYSFTEMIYNSPV